MSLPIITADQRLAEPRGIKGCIFGKSGIGKTSLLWTLDPARPLFIDLEAGDLAIEGWPGDSIRPRTWAECRDFAVFIGGPNPALRDEQPYSPAHHAAVCQKFGDPAALDRARAARAAASALSSCARDASTSCRATTPWSARLLLR